MKTIEVSWKCSHPNARTAVAVIPLLYNMDCRSSTMNWIGFLEAVKSSSADAASTRPVHNSIAMTAKNDLALRQYSMAAKVLRTIVIS